MISLNNDMPPANRKRQNVFRRLGFVLTNFWTTMYYARTKVVKTYTPKTFCGTQNKNSHAKVWKVSLENTTAWKIKSSTSSLDLCAPNKLAHITVLEATKMMEQKSSMTDGVQKKGATVKNVKRCQPVKNACAVTKFRQLRHFI